MFQYAVKNKFYSENTEKENTHLFHQYFSIFYL
jgi:hypothetical protein